MNNDLLPPLNRIRELQGKRLRELLCKQINKKFLFLPFINERDKMNRLIGRIKPCYLNKLKEKKYIDFSINLNKRNTNTLAQDCMLNSSVDKINEPLDSFSKRVPGFSSWLFKGSPVKFNKRLSNDSSTTISKNNMNEVHKKAKVHARKKKGLLNTFISNRSSSTHEKAIEKIEKKLETLIKTCEAEQFFYKEQAKKATNLQLTLQESMDEVNVRIRRITNNIFNKCKS